MRQDQQHELLDGDRDPLLGFVMGWQMPYTVGPPKFAFAATVFPVRNKSGFAMARRGGMVHRTLDVASLCADGQVRYAARWRCAGYTRFAVLVGDSAGFGIPCTWCEGSDGPVVYRCFGRDGQLLYVGCTTSYRQRSRVHQSQTAWWAEVAKVTRQEYATITEATTAELRAIATENPLYNVAGKAASRG